MQTTQQFLDFSLLSKTQLNAAYAHFAWKGEIECFFWLLANFKQFSCKIFKKFGKKTKDTNMKQESSLF